MRGVITGRDVLRNTATIVREFGPAAYGRCVLALATGRPRTFLAAVSANAPARSRAHRGTFAVGAALLASVSLTTMRPPGPTGDAAPCVPACCEALGHPSAP